MLTDLTTQKSELTSLLLCGGAGRRMLGRDKPLELWHGKPLVAHVLRALPKGPVLISANRSLAHYQSFNWPVVTDPPAAGRHAGPLAGIAAATPHIHSPWLFAVAGDTPRLPRGLAAALLQSCKQHDAVAACVQTDRLQPLPLLVHKLALETLPPYLASGERSVLGWLQQLGMVTLDQRAEAHRFANINTPEQLATLNNTQPDTD